MIRVRYRGGIELDHGMLWLDPEGCRPRAAISHAHGDHIGRHDLILSTPETAALLRHRLGEDLTILEHPYREPFGFGDYTVEFYSAGHILGSAMILVERGGYRLLYTGDYQPRGGATCPPAEVPRCDCLVMESTYGLPQYRFPPREEVLAAMTDFARSSLEEGVTPVFLAYALGKGQEVAKALGEAGVEVAAWRSVFEMIEIYRRFGHVFPNVHLFAGSGDVRRALILPPGRRHRRIVKGLDRKRVGYVSGWALHRRPSRPLEADAWFPLSDHAGYDELCQLVERAQPGEVLVMHGFADAFSRDLRERGYRAVKLAS